MVRAAQKGDLKDPSPEVADVADDINVKDAKKFAKTKHKGLPEKKGVNEASAVLDANTKIKNEKKRKKDQAKLAKLTHIYKGMKTGQYNSHELEGEVIDERLGGRGYKRRKDYAGREVSGDWEDSDRGGGHKSIRRAGGEVEKKSPTYLAHIKNKKKKQEVNEGKLDRIMNTVRAYSKKRKPEKKAEKAMDAGARAKRLLQRKQHAKYVSGSTENVPDDIRDHYTHI